MKIFQAAAVQPIEIIVNANPAEPPVSLLALRNIWQDTDVQISSFKHSSVKVNVPKWENLKENNRRNKILVTLIWKNGKREQRRKYIQVVEESV